jgi:hypothetical protein
MFLAGIPVPDKLVLDLARRLRESGLDDTAETARSRETRVLASEVDETGAILRALTDWPDEFAELRVVLLHEHERTRDGGH